MKNEKKMMIFHPTEEDLEAMGVAEIDDEDAMTYPVKEGREIVSDGRLSNGAVLFGLFWISLRSEKQTEKWYANKMAISMSTLYRYKKELREAGYVE